MAAMHGCLSLFPSFFFTPPKFSSLIMVKLLFIQRQPKVPRLHGSPPLRQNRCFLGWLVTLDGPPLEEALDPGLLGTPPSSPT